jgi:hypothetical protein
MSRSDALVAALAILAGLALIGGAIFNAAWLNNLAKSRLAADLLGSRGARVLFALLGFGMIALGFVIASGWRMH